MVLCNVWNCKTEAWLKIIEWYSEDEYVNLWFNENDKRQNLYPTSNIFLLKPDKENNVFHSGKINFRFIVPVTMRMMLCDKNQNDSCEPIENIIHPAPYDLANRIDTNRLVVSLTLAVMGIGVLNVWARLKNS